MFSYQFLFVIRNFFSFVCLYGDWNRGVELETLFHRIVLFKSKNVVTGALTLLFGLTFFFYLEKISFILYCV